LEIEGLFIWFIKRNPGPVGTVEKKPVFYGAKDAGDAAGLELPGGASQKA
jgi:hypothetical protein